jgi:hypothetical protein
MEVLEMHRRFLMFSTVVTAAIVVFLWAPVSVAAQAQSREEVQEAARKVSPHSAEGAAEYWNEEVEAKIAAAVASVYDPAKPPTANPPRTPWGDPDLRGYYLTTSYTPLQRPQGVDKALYTHEEAINAFTRRSVEDSGVDPATVHYDWKEFGMDAWQSPVRPSLRTGLIVDPPDGRIPALTPEAQKRRAEAAARAKTTNPETGVSIFGNTYTRCVLGNAVAPLGTGGVTSEMQLFQSPGYLTIIHQSNNDVRVIPIDGRQHLAESNRQWYGDSRARWEGNTLVIETTNFRDRAPAVGPQGSGESLRLTERFTVLDDKTIRYEYTMNDPDTWTKPWSVEAIYPRIDPPLYEFACHEQNYGLINLVMGAQISATRGDAPARGGAE